MIVEKVKNLLKIRATNSSTSGFKPPLDFVELSVLKIKKYKDWNFFH